MTNSIRAAILLLTAVTTATAPQLPSFEVAVIRPSAADAAGTNFMLSSSRFSVTNAPLTDLIQFAYNLKTNQQVPKTPAWIASQKFDIDATIADADRDALNKLPADQKLEQYRLRVRTLLADRFHFQASMQTKDLPVYALVLAKGGPKPALVPAPSDTLAQRTPTLGGFSSGQVKAGAVSMAVFADWLSGRPDVRRPSRSGRDRPQGQLRFHPRLCAIRRTAHSLRRIQPAHHHSPRRRRPAAHRA